MSCETANYLYTRCPEVVSTNCITYQGESIDCLGICKGMTLTKLEDIVVNKICDLATLTNMSVIDFTHKCPWIATAWNNAHPGNHPNVDNTILNILNFILDELCILNTKVDGLPTTTEVEFPLNYSCCGGVCDTPTNVNIPTHLQNIIDCICDFKTYVGTINLPTGTSSLSTYILSLNQQIQAQQIQINSIPVLQCQITALSSQIACIINQLKTYTDGNGDSINVICGLTPCP